MESEILIIYKDPLSSSLMIRVSVLSDFIEEMEEVGGGDVVHYITLDKDVEYKSGRLDFT